MKIKILLVIILLPFLAPAQTIVSFLDEQSQQPIPGVVVKSSTKNTYLSDEKGEIRITIASPTEMIASHISYGLRSFLAAPDEQLSIRLQRTQIPLTE